MVFAALRSISSALLRHTRLCGWVDESEDIVEDVVAAGAVGQELEGLNVAHWPSLLLDLEKYAMSDRPIISIVSWASLPTEHRSQ